MWLTQLRRRKQITSVVLEPLDEAETATLAGHVAGCELGAEARAVLYRETEGNPLFIVEMSRADARASLAVCDRAQEVAPDTGPSTLPPRVHAVIQQRLAQLSTAGRDLADVASVIGREFSFAVVAEVSRGDEGAVVAALDELCERGIFRERERGTYDFGHDKIRGVTYDELSRGRRRLLHGRAARALEALSAGHPEAAGDLARHYASAGETEKAITYRQAAAQRALELSAHREAARHLRQALELLDTQLRSADRDRTELACRMALASAMIPQHGFAAPEVREMYDRAVDLAQRLGEEPQLVPVLYGLGQYYMLQGEWGTSRALGEQCLELAQETREPALLLLAHALLGFVLSYMGLPGEASKHLERSLALYEQQSEPPIPGTDLGVMCRCYSALVLWLRGYPQQSLAEMDAALRLAHELSRPHSLAAALNHASGLHLLRREPDVTQRYADRAIALSTDSEFSHWAALSRVVRGWALSQEGRQAEGLVEARRGLDRTAALGVDLTSYSHTLLAEIEGSANDFAQGLCAVDQAMSAQDGGLRAFASMTLRVKAELLESRGASLDEVEACYRAAIDVAQVQKARMFELQATLGLCRLLQKRGRQAEARELLDEIYDWFTEGFASPDLRAARALLEELA
jgi:adenylate cyclase